MGDKVAHQPDQTNQSDDEDSQMTTDGEERKKQNCQGDLGQLKRKRLDVVIPNQPFNFRTDNGTSSTLEIPAVTKKYTADLRKEMIESYKAARENLAKKELALNAVRAHLLAGTLPGDLGFTPSVFHGWVDHFDKGLIAQHNTEYSSMMQQFKEDLLRLRYNIMKSEYDLSCDTMNMNAAVATYIDTLRTKYLGPDLAINATLEAYFTGCANNYKLQLSLAQSESAVDEELATSSSAAKASKKAAAAAHRAAATAAAIPASSPPTATPSNATASVADTAPLTRAAVVSLVTDTIRTELKNFTTHFPGTQQSGPTNQSTHGRRNGRDPHQDSYRQQQQQQQPRQQQPRPQQRSSHRQFHEDPPFHAKANRPVSARSRSGSPNASVSGGSLQRDGFPNAESNHRGKGRGGKGSGRFKHQSSNN